RGVRRSAHLASASSLVSQRPPTRTPSSRTRWPSGPGTPSVIHRRTQLKETGRPPRAGGSRRAASHRPSRVSVRRWEGLAVMLKPRASRCRVRHYTLLKARPRDEAILDGCKKWPELQFGKNTFPDCNSGGG